MKAQGVPSVIRVRMDGSIRLFSSKYSTLFLPHGRLDATQDIFAALFFSEITLLS
jgi:hypothetical protein